MWRVGDEGAVLQGAKTPAAAASGSPYAFRTPATSRRMQQASSCWLSHGIAEHYSAFLHEVSGPSYVLSPYRVCGKAHA